MTQEAALPEFARPPLIEVVLGVQFATPSAYSQIMAGDVRQLYRSHYPGLAEQPALPPQFETFGGGTQASLNFGLLATQHDRFWFLSPDGHELLQFQHDRLLHNWRKLNVPQAQYPRFETMLPAFKRELAQLDGFFHSIGDAGLAPNQCEITYVNHIPIAQDGSCQAEEWLTFLNFPAGAPDEIFCNLRDIVVANDTRIGRLYVDLRTIVLPDSRRFLALQLSVKGLPLAPTIDGALDFLRMGRELIVSKFAEITSDSAHKSWGRTR